MSPHLFDYLVMQCVEEKQDKCSSVALYLTTFSHKEIPSILLKKWHMDFFVSLGNHEENTYLFHSIIVVVYNPY